MRGAKPEKAVPKAKPARRRATPAVRLNPDHALAFQPDACLNAARAEYGCDICATACPVEAIRPEGFGVALSDRCLDCGQCTTACPTGALSLPAPMGAILECARVPEAERFDGATVVPCLGGVSATRLLEQTAEAAPVLVDRGLCAGCRLGAGRAAPWAEALESARDLAAAACVRPEALPRVVTAPALRAPLPLHGEEVDTGRRGFLRSLAPKPDPVTHRFERVGRVEAPALARRQAAVGDLAARTGRPVPVGTTAMVTATEACRLHGLCAATCPTGALAHGLSDTEALLAFDAARCIACNACVAICPEKALLLDPAGGAAAPPEPVALARRGSRACLRCDTAFLPDVDETTCPFCARSNDLMREVSDLMR